MVMLVKANGERVLFDEMRLLRSLMNSGAENYIAERVLDKIRPQIVDGIATKKLYSLAFKALRKIDNPSASRYELKWAIMRLGRGRQGFSFEQYAGSLFRRMGYNVKLNQLVKGKSGVIHEVDLVAEKQGERIMVECKHRSKPGIWINVHTPLYVYARFMDLNKRFTSAAVVTNSRFSTQSEMYAKSVGLRLLGWNYPIKESLKDLADKYAVYPVTVLGSIDNNMLSNLLDRELVTVSDIMAVPKDSLSGMFGQENAIKIYKEATKLLLS